MLEVGNISRDEQGAVVKFTGGCHTKKLSQQITGSLILLALLVQRDASCCHGDVNPGGSEAHQERAVCMRAHHSVITHVEFAMS